MKAARRPLSKRTRFEVFKRDKFACQYCGSKAPDVVLQCDHIKPVAGGGDDSALNLITSCQGCNGGKGAVPLSDDSAITRQRDQLAALEERRQQIEMMLEWRTELASQDTALLNACEEAWKKIAVGWQWSTSGKAVVAKLVKRHGFIATLDAIDATGLRFPNAAETKAEPAIVDRMFKHLATVLKYGNDPTSQRIAYLIGILKNRCRDRQVMYHADVRSVVDAGIDVDRITQIAKDVDSWREFEDWCIAVVKARE